MSLIFGLIGWVFNILYHFLHMSLAKIVVILSFLAATIIRVSIITNGESAYYISGIIIFLLFLLFAALSPASIIALLLAFMQDLPIAGLHWAWKTVIVIALAILAYVVSSLTSAFDDTARNFFTGLFWGTSIFSAATWTVIYACIFSLPDEALDLAEIVTTVKLFPIAYHNCPWLLFALLITGFGTFLMVRKEVLYLSN